MSKRIVSAILCLAPRRGPGRPRLCSDCLFHLYR